MQGEVDEFYKQAILPIKNILTILLEFVDFIYSEMISSFEKKLDAEDKYDKLVVHNLLTQLVFDDVSSGLYACVYHCLELKSHKDIQQFKKMIKEFGSKCLKDLDDQVKDKFTLNGCSEPYRNVIEILKLCARLPNPYMKKDYLTSLEDEMILSIQNFYESQGEQIEQIQIEPDDKFAIYTYCLLKSDYTNVILDIAFIEEFTVTEENNQAYARLVGCLQDYILSGDMERFLSER